MRVKGLRVDWRGSRGRGLAEASRGRRDVKTREEYIVGGSFSSS